jgi:hypothetical protein
VLLNMRDGRGVHAACVGASCRYSFPFSDAAACLHALESFPLRRSAVLFCPLSGPIVLIEKARAFTSRSLGAFGPWGRGAYSQIFGVEDFGGLG